MGLIFHPLFSVNEVAAEIAKRRSGIDFSSSSLTSKNFRDLHAAIERAYKSTGVSEALRAKVDELKRKEKSNIEYGLKQIYPNREKEVDDLSSRIIEYKAYTSKEIIDLIVQSDAITSFKIEPEPKTKEASLLKLENYLLGNYAAQIIDIGLRAELLRVIDAAGPAGISDNDLAERLGFAPVYVQWWCKAAYAFEVLDYDTKAAPAKYTLGPNMKSLLLEPDDLDFLGDEFMLSTALFQEFQDFPTYLYTGQIKSRSEIDPRVRKFYQNLTQDDAFIITHLVLPQAPEVLDRLQYQGSKILDIGTGAGDALVRYAECFPNAQVIGLDIDLPSVLLAQRKIAQQARDYADRIEVRFGDAHQLRDENAYDLITINLALHEMGIRSRDVRDVLENIFRALKPGGAVVICAFYAAEKVAAYRNTTYQQWLSLHLHEVLLGSSMLSPEELLTLLRGLHFHPIRPIDHPINGYLMVIAEKKKPPAEKETQLGGVDNS